MTEESAYWRQLIEDLQEVMTIPMIAGHLEEEERKIHKWKSGKHRPTGWSAIGLFLLHVKHCPNRQRQIRHYAEAGKTT